MTEIEQEFPYMQDSTPNVAHPLAESPLWSCLYSANLKQTKEEISTTQKLDWNINLKLIAQIEARPAFVDVSHYNHYHH